ncbi:MAG: hypothetical protein IPF82_11710 [Blastocatellia bacterium]|nr:hypothetical protein [Blastocatellia bacterium]
MLELYRAAYAGDGAEMTGVQVMDEFETMSGPVLMAATTSLGEVYDVALTMAFARSAELEIGSGWPPVVIGIDLLIPVGLSSVTRAQSGDVEAIVHGGSTQSIAIVITSRDVNAAALRHAAESARSLLRARNRSPLPFRRRRRQPVAAAGVSSSTMLSARPSRKHSIRSARRRHRPSETPVDLSHNP